MHARDEPPAWGQRAVPVSPPAIRVARQRFTPSTCNSSTKARLNSPIQCSMFLRLPVNKLSSTYTMCPCNQSSNRAEVIFAVSGRRDCSSREVTTGGDRLDVANLHGVMRSRHWTTANRSLLQAKFQEHIAAIHSRKNTIKRQHQTLTCIMSASVKLEPTKPAPPVIKMRFCFSGFPTAG